ncbi:MAG: ion transporter [Candidatus Limnocylindrales bacterium]
MASIDKHIGRVEWGKQQDNGEVLLSPAWEVFVFGVSILSVLNLLLVGVFRNPHLDQVFVIMDALLTVVFLLDLARRLAVADDRRRYLTGGSGWIDVVAAFPLLRILRILRIVRMIRVMQRLGGPLNAFKAFFSNRAAGGLLSVLLVAILVLEFGALAILGVEDSDPDANIITAADAVWYVLVTMSTVGYGDLFPVTDLGRLIGSLIIVVGVGVFGTLTGFLANAFLAPSEAAAAVVPPNDDRTAGSEGEESPESDDGPIAPDE